MKIVISFTLALFSFVVVFAQNPMFSAGNRNYSSKSSSTNTGSSTFSTAGLVLNLDASKIASYSGSGTNWNDISGSNNVFTLPAPLVANFSSQDGGSFFFNNSSIYSVQNTNVRNLNIATANAVTFEFWVKHITVVGYQFYLSSPGAVYRFGISNGGSFFWDMGRHVDRNYASNPLPFGVWKHVVFTGGLESGNIVTRFYVDGQFITSMIEGNFILPDLTNIYLGCGEQSNLYLFNGRMASTRIYKRVLSAAEVLQNFNSAKAQFGL